jgi:hypothetical protein
MRSVSLRLARTSSRFAPANTFAAIHNSAHEKWNRYSDSTRRALEVLNLFDIKPLRPLMLALAQKFSDKEAEKAFQLSPAPQPRSSR